MSCLCGLRIFPDSLSDVRALSALNYKQSDGQYSKAINAFLTSLSHYFIKQLNDELTLEF